MLNKALLAVSISLAETKHSNTWLNREEFL